MPFSEKIDIAKLFKIINHLRSFPVLPEPYHKIWRYFSPLIVLFLAIFCDLHFKTFRGYPSILVFAAVIFSTWYAGFGPGLITIALAVVSIDYFFTKPVDTLNFNSGYIAQSIVFVSAALLISSLVESQRRAEQIVNMVVNKQKRFIADASHELFTPLSVIRAQSEIALQDPVPNLANCREVILSTIGEVDRMAKIVENLLELSRNEFQIEEDQFSPVELREIAKSVLDKLKILADGKNIHLAVAGDDAGKISGDAAALTHMIINLVQNSIQYTPAGGKISVGVFAKDKAMRLTVRDTGMGIAPEHLPHIFDPFYKTDEARRRRQSGAGLGLAIVKGVADAHNGKITVESKFNQGTAITVEFPKVLLAT